MTNNKSDNQTIVVVKKRRFSKSPQPQVTKKEEEIKVNDTSSTRKSLKSNNLDHLVKGGHNNFVDLDSKQNKKSDNKVKNNNHTDPLDKVTDNKLSPKIEEKILKEPKDNKPKIKTDFKAHKQKNIETPSFDLNHIKTEHSDNKSEKKKITEIKLAGSKTFENKNNFNSKPRYVETRKIGGKFSDDSETTGEKVHSLAALKRKREKIKKQISGIEEYDNKEDSVKTIIIPEFITVQELANRMAIRSADVVKELMKMGMMITANKQIDADTAEIIITEFGHKIKRVLDSDIELVLEREEYKDEKLMKARHPIVTVMGHVDHGKTSLLDALRETDVVAKESGGITQHIGASLVTINDGKKVTFIDTPGHAAFTQMRMHGAKVTDIVILVVAADDGVKEQTIEAINHAKAAKIPIIVAVNKMDKEGANSKKVLNELLSHDIITEELGGDCLSVEVSALKRMNLDKLFEQIMLQSELLDLKANYNCPAKGTIIETKLDKNKGILATIIVQHGILKIGDIMLAGNAFGKVKSMKNDKALQVNQAGPSDAIVVLGLDQVPDSGQLFHIVESEKIARDIIAYRVDKQRNIEAATKNKKSIDDIFKNISDDESKKSLDIIIKADVRGSADAISNSLEKISDDKVKINILHLGVGGINDSDITLAQASNAMIFGFNVRTVSNIKESDLKDINIKYYSIIYDLINDTNKLVKGLLDPVFEEKSLGKVEIRKIFNISKAGKIAGCYVLNGVVKRNANCRIIRDSKVIQENKIKVLKRFQDDVKTVNTGMECGIAFDNFSDIKENDQIEVYEMETKDG